MYFFPIKGLLLFKMKPIKNIQNDQQKIHQNNMLLIRLWFDLINKYLFSRGLNLLLIYK
jgi:hypothetical protein